MLSFCRPHGLGQVETPTWGVRVFWCILLEQGEGELKACTDSHFSEGCGRENLYPLSSFPPQGVGVFAQLVARDGECPAPSSSPWEEDNKEEGSGEPQGSLTQSDPLPFPSLKAVPVSDL